MSISLYETYFYILCLHIIQSLILWPLKPKTALTLTAVCTSQKGNINNFIFIGGSVLWLQASYIYPGYSVSEAIFFTFKWLVSFFFIFFSMAFSFFSCMCVCKCTKFTQIVSMQTDQEWREDVLYLLIPFRCQTATPLV